MEKKKKKKKKKKAMIWSSLINSLKKNIISEKDSWILNKTIFLCILWIIKRNNNK